MLAKLGKFDGERGPSNKVATGKNHCQRRTIEFYLQASGPKMAGVVSKENTRPEPDPAEI